MSDKNRALKFVPADLRIHMPECTVCDTSRPEDLKDAVAVVFRPVDPPMLAQVYCRACLHGMITCSDQTLRRRAAS